MFSVIRAFLFSFQGKETSQTDRLVAGLLLAIFTVIFGRPEMCRSSFRTGVTYNNLFFDELAFAKALPEILESSTKTSLVFVLLLLIESFPAVIPPGFK